MAKKVVSKKACEVAYEKKFVTPEYLERKRGAVPKGNVFSTSIRRIGAGIYVNIPLAAYAHLYKELPLGGSLSLVIRKDGVVELKKNGSY